MKFFGALKLGIQWNILQQIICTVSHPKRVAHRLHEYAHG